jgi:small-conductance mechanosensitive channel
MSTEQTRIELLDELKDETGDKLRRLSAMQRKAKERVEWIQGLIDEFDYLSRYIKTLYRPQFQPSAISLTELDNMLEQVDEFIEQPENVPVHMFRQLRLVLLKLKSEILSRQCQRDGTLAFEPSKDLDAANLAP